LFAAQGKALDINQGALQARATRAIEILKESVKSISQLTLESPKLDRRLREISDHFKVIGKTPHDLLALLAQLVDPLSVLTGPDVTDDLRKGAEDCLFDILNSYRMVEDEHKLVAISHVEDLLKRVDNHADRELLKNQLELFGGAGTSITKALEQHSENESVLEGILGNYLDKPLQSSSELEVGVAIGKLTSLVDQSEAKAIQTRKKIEEAVGISEADQKFAEDLASVVQGFANRSGVDIKMLPAILTRIAIRFEQDGGTNGDC
jgi:hypothetical protein